MTVSYYEFKPRLSPEGYAREVLYQLKVNQFPVDVKEVVRARGIIYRESDFQGINTFDGYLIRKNGKAVIIINSSIPYTERVNFSAAHELGHFEIPHHDRQEYRCLGRDLEAYKTEKRHEYEANRFATELLMPEVQIQKRVKKHPFSLEQVVETSRDFGTSLTSAALRLVQFTPDRCAIVISGAVSDKGQILWSSRSSRFRYELRVGVLSDDTYAADFFKGVRVPKGPQKVGHRGWIATPGVPNDLDIIEHSVPFPNLGLVLTLLSIPDMEDDEDLDEDFY